MTGSGTTGEIAGVILAGGRARRLGGRQEAFLEIGRERIIDRQLRALCKVTTTQLNLPNDPERLSDLGVSVASCLRFLLQDAPHADAVVPTDRSRSQPLGAVYAVCLEPAGPADPPGAHVERRACTATPPLLPLS